MKISRKSFLLIAGATSLTAVGTSKLDAQESITVLDQELDRVLSS